MELPCGKLSLRNVDFWVIDQPMNELLLGRPLLKCLGFDLDKLLNGLCEKGETTNVADRLVNDINSKNSITLAFVKNYAGLWYNQEEFDPVEPLDSVASYMGDDSKESIRKALSITLEAAKKEGMSAKGVIECRKILNEYRDTLRIKLGSDEPAKVDSYAVTLKVNYRPYCSTQRRYALPQRAFIESTVLSLEKIGAVRHNHISKWTSPALAVPKPGTDRLRFTDDLRGVNNQTVPTASAMHDVETMYRSLEGSTCFANIDMCHAYWQIQLDSKSQEIISIPTPSGVYTPNRILQGSTDAGNHFQAVTSRAFREINEFMLQWLDDFLLHAKTESSLISILRTFFKLSSRYGLKVHAEKITLFSNSVKFCGREIDKDEVRYDPRSLNSLANIP